MITSLFRIDALSAMVMMAVRDAPNKTPLGVKSYMKKDFELNLDIETICQSLKELASADFCQVTVGENTWRVTDKGNAILRDYLIEPFLSRGSRRNRR